MTCIIGITGGFGTGKTTVLKMFGKLGAKTIDVDKLYHRLIERRTSCYKAIVKAFGKEILNKNHSINRKLLGKIVFNDSRKKKELEKVTHPYIKKKLKEEMKKYKTYRVIAVEVPLLIEARLFNVFDIIVLVIANERNRMCRVKSKFPYMKSSEIKKIIKNQMPLSKKKKYADIVINNNRNPKEVFEDVRNVIGKASEYV